MGLVGVVGVGVEAAGVGDEGVVGLGGVVFGGPVELVVGTGAVGVAGVEGGAGRSGAGDGTGVDGLSESGGALGVVAAGVVAAGVVGGVGGVGVVGAAGGCEGCDGALVSELPSGALTFSRGLAQFEHQRASTRLAVPHEGQRTGRSPPGPAPWVVSFPGWLMASNIRSESLSCGTSRSLLLSGPPGAPLAQRRRLYQRPRS